jgi:hypothetical protein
MATSALKTMSAVDPSFFDNDQVYATQFEKAKDAEQKLMDLLDQKKNQNLSPSMLALTGALFDPGRTGSLGEAIGRGATAYGAALQQEHKGAMEDAAMQMQLENMRLGRAQQAQSLKMLGSLKGRQGAEGTTPPGASGPLLSVNGMMVTPDDITRMMIVNPDLGTALEKGYKLKLESISTQPGYIIDKITGKATPLPGGEAKPVSVPEIGGTLLMGPEDVMAYREAKAKGDAKAVYQIIDRLSKGISRPTETAPTVTTPTAPAPAVTAPVVKAPEQRPMTQEAIKAQSAADEAAATQFAKDNAERTTKFLAAADESRVPRAAAAQNIEILKNNPKIVGYLNKPGVGNAVWSVIQNSVNAHVSGNNAGMDVKVNNTDLEKELMKIDKNFKLKDFTDLGILASNLARLELGMRRAVYAGSGMGSVSNLEGQPIKETIGSRYDTADALKSKMALAGRGFDYDMDVAKAYRTWAAKPENKYKNIEDFKRDTDSPYEKLTKDFESWISENLKIPTRNPNSIENKTTTSSNTIMDEIKRRKELKKNKGN